jgi:hypothetical protein
MANIKDRKIKLKYTKSSYCNKIELLGLQHFSLTIGNHKYVSACNGIDVIELTKLKDSLDDLKKRGFPYHSIHNISFSFEPIDIPILKKVCKDQSGSLLNIRNGSIFLQYFCKHKLKYFPKQEIEFHGKN